MRHNKKFNHLGRQKGHRELMLSNMACSLILHKRINTTVAKAKALRMYVEPIITRAKDDTTHARRVAFSDLRSKYAVTELFSKVREEVGDRPGGYTRIVRTGHRPGDNAEMCLIELVDFNKEYSQAKATHPTASRTRRTRRGKGGAAKTQPALAQPESGAAAPEQPQAATQETVAESSPAQAQEASASEK